MVLQNKQAEHAQNKITENINIEETPPRSSQYSNAVLKTEWDIIDLRLPDPLETSIS